VGGVNLKRALSPPTKQCGSPSPVLGSSWDCEKTLSDQGALKVDKESEGEAQLAFTCPSCGETNKVNLPEGWTVAEGEEEEEAEGRGQRLRTKCSKCGETYSVEPPDGTHFGRRKAAGEAARAFARDYGRAIEASRLRHGALRIL